MCALIKTYETRRLAANDRRCLVVPTPILCYYSPRMDNRPMDKTIRRYTDFAEMKADEYRYWQSRPAHERVAAVSKLTQEHYALRGTAPRLQKTLVRFERLRNPTPKT